MNRSPRPHRRFLLPLRPWLTAGILLGGLGAHAAAAADGGLAAWQAARDRAQAAYAAGALDQAEPAAREALARARAGQGDNAAFVASSLNLLALVQQGQGRNARAVELLQEALRLDASAPRDPAASAALALNLGAALEAARRDDEAMAAYRHSLDIAQGHAAAEPARLRALAALARMLAAHGQAGEAGRVNRQLRDSAAALSPRERARAQLQQARLQLAQGQAPAAEQALRQALESIDGSAPAAADITVEALGELAALYGRQGRRDEAAPLHRRTAALLEQASPPQPRALASQWNELSLWHLQRGEFDAARGLLDKALGLVEPLPANGLETARIVSNQAQVEEAAANPQQADLLWRRALALYQQQEAQPEAQLGQAQALNFLAGQDYRRHRLAQAERQFLLALSLTEQAGEQAGGARSERLLPLLDNLAALYRARRQDEQAAIYVRRAAALRATGAAP